MHRLAWRSVAITLLTAELAMLLGARSPVSFGGSWSQLPRTNLPRQAATVVPAEQLVAQLSAGERIDLEGVTVDGNLDFRRAGAIKPPLRCHYCQFRGSVDAADVVFERLVDLSGSTIEGPVQMRGALFRERVTFDDAELSSVALDSARFLDDASFSKATFRGGLTLDRARIGRTGDFSRSVFWDVASFKRTGFEGKADFAGARFMKEASFEDADLRAGGSFRAARFQAASSFERLSADRSLDFEGAIFEGDSTLSNLTSSGTVSLEGVQAPGAHLFIEQMAVKDLRMEVRSVAYVRGTIAQKNLLQLIETSAEARRDLALANDARFERLSLDGRETKENGKSIAYFLDRVVYQDVAGYLVRPSRPLRALFLVLLAAALVRGVPPLWRSASRRRPEPRGQRSNPHPRGSIGRAHDALLVSQKAGTILLSGLAASFAAAVRRKAGIEVKDRERVRSYVAAGIAWFEFLAYKVLIAVFLVTLGNSNATVRQIFDAVVAS